MSYNPFQHSALFTWVQFLTNAHISNNFMKREFPFLNIPICKFSVKEDFCSSAKSVPWKHWSFSSPLFSQSIDPRMTKKNFLTYFSSRSLLAIGSISIFGCILMLQYVSICFRQLQYVSTWSCYIFKPGSIGNWTWTEAWRCELLTSWRKLPAEIRTWPHVVEGNEQLRYDALKLAKKLMTNTSYFTFCQWQFTEV